MKASRAAIVALLAVWFPAVALAAGFAHIMKISAPLVTGLSPIQVTAGQEVVLRLRGRALRNGLRARFGPGIATGPVRRASADGSRASLRIRVAAGAAPGRRRLVLVQGVTRLPQNAYLSVRAQPVIVPPPRGIHIERQGGGQGVPGIMVLGAPVLTRVTPQSVRAGSRLKLKLEGSGLRPGLQVDYGSGVHVESLRVLDATRAVATVQIDASAAAGSRVPLASEPRAQVRVMPRAALRISGAPVKVYGIAPSGTQTSTPTRIAPPARITPLAAAERLLGVTPAGLEAGRDYSVIAYGENLRAGLELDLGAGVKISAVDVLDARRAQVSLHVDAGAQPGSRQARIRTAQGEPWALQAATVVIQAPFHVARLPQPKLPAFPTKVAVEGRILLKRPKWYSGLASKPPPRDPLTGKALGPGEVIKTGVDVPTVKDDSLFVWREQNPGLAEWFEVRFYAGGKLIATRRIDKQRVAFTHAEILPTWLVPDPDLVAALGHPVARSSGRAARAGPGTAKIGGVAARVNRGAGGQGNELPPSDLTWEVAGYRRYFKSGVERQAALALRPPILLASLSSRVPNQERMGTMAAREVERSERWPVNAPSRPTGLGCGSEAYSTLDVTNEDRGTTSTGAVSTSNHTGERWKVTGVLDLDRSPWASHPQKLQSASGHPKKVQSTTWNFDNVYIDWGDGRVVPLSASQSGNAGDYKADKKLDFGAMENEGAFTHAYSETGTYTVRIYQLAEADIQSESAGNVSVAANPSGSLYAVAQAAAGARAGGSNGSAAPRGFRHAKSTGDHAYMLMCRQVTISPRHDSDSDGPLNLVAAKLRGFPEQPGDATPPKGVKVAPSAPEQSSGPRLAVGAGEPGAGVRASRRSSHPRIGSSRFARRSSAAGEPSFSTCDVSLAGGGYLYYYGQGKVRLTWTLDGASIGSQTVALGPSTPRSDQVLSGKDPGPPLVSASDLLTSASIALTQNTIGHHKLGFDAQVQFDARGIGRLSRLMGRALGSGRRKPDRKLAAQLAAGLHGAPPLGVLPPQGVQIPRGSDPVAWLDVPLQRVAQGRPRPVLVAALERGRADFGDAAELGGALRSARSMPARKPPAYVAAPPRAFRVTGAKSGEACVFHFPVKDGEFILGGLQSSGGQSNVTHQGNLWSGSGRLIVPMAGGEAYVQLSFKNWTLAADGTTVASGSFDVANPFEPRQISGIEAKVLRLQGTAGDSVRMTVSATLKNPNILASDDQKPPPPLQATAVLTPKGDWYADGLSMPELGVYDSGFKLTPKSVALDLSAGEGSACGAGGSGWMGVAFGAGSQLQAYSFDLKKTEAGAVSGWGIDAEGLCGTKTFGAAYDSPVERGTIHWDSIDAKASGGAFTADYNGVRVHVPWLDTDLTGNSQALRAGKGSGGGGIELKLTGNAPAHTYGPITMKADALSFTTLKGASWAVLAGKTSFSFKADGRQFASNVPVSGLYFGMDGKAYFDGSGGNAHVGLSGAKGRLSQGVVDLKSMDVVATPQASSRLLFNFSTELRISDALPAAPAPVSYRIDQVSAKQYSGSGPVTGTFEIHKPFPDANPSTDSVIHPSYAGPQGGQSASADPGGWLIASAHAASGSHMTYCGDVDLGMFGGPPVKGGFALGYQGSDDFWAARADVSVGGQTGTPLVPPYMTLYVVGGGLGYDITLDSFNGGSSCDVKANIDHTPVFNAHLQVGDPSHFAYGFDGKFTVKLSGPEAGARMDYKAWLARSTWTGGGDFYGHFLYANGNFDGTLNGHYGFLDNQVYIEATNDAIAMHFGGGKWYIHAGTEPNPVRGHVLIVNAAAWLGLGSDGMYAGAKANLNEGAGDCGGVCARVTADTVMEAELTTQPHVSADAHLHLDAHACAFDICLGAGLGGSMHVAALPPELGFSFRLGGCPPGHLDVGLQILPSPKPEIGGGVCLW